jgi:hypothetical protein
VSGVGVVGRARWQFVEECLDLNTSASSRREASRVMGFVGTYRLARFAGLRRQHLAGGGGPSLGTKLFREAQAPTSVPSTRECPALNTDPLVR